MIPAMTPVTKGAGRWTAPEMVLAVIMVVFLVPNFSHALYCGYEQGWWPLKPRDFNLGLAACALVTVLFCKPAFSLMALALLTVPLPRILDAALLRRYEILEYGGHDVYVLTMVSLWIIAAVGIFATGTSRGPRIATLVAAGTILACTGANFYEWLGFASWTLIPGRMSGWHYDPNNSPIIMCLMLGILFTVEKRFWWNLVWTAVGAAGVALTMSRSGMMVFFVMVSAYVLSNLRERLLGLLVLGCIGLPLLAAGLGVLGASGKAGNSIRRNEDTDARMEAIYNLDLEKLKSPERKKDLLDAWEAVGARPVEGWGMGAGELKWRPHNMVVAQWLDVGILGVIQYVGALLTFTLVCVLRRFRAVFSLIPVWLFIPCSQMLLEMPAYWYAWGVAAYALFPRRFALALSSHAPATARAPV